MNALLGLSCVLLLGAFACGKSSHDNAELDASAGGAGTSNAGRSGSSGGAAGVATAGAPSVPGARCGDGVVDADDERCDDGNLRPGDGCSGLCQIEPSSVCPPDEGACDTTVVCGSGVREPSEACDDGNRADGDGCSADCSHVEPGYYCTSSACTTLAKCSDEKVASCAHGCGDGVVGGGEACDDGVNSGAYGTCGPGCVLGPRCGDGVVERPFEECDDGVNSGAYGTCAPGCKWGAYCGNGVVEAPEQCDALPAEPCCERCRITPCTR